MIFTYLFFQNDPTKQKEAFDEQQKTDDKSSIALNDTFLNALEYGLPPNRWMGNWN